MGIKGLKQFLRSKFPSTLVTSHLSHWWGKKAAIDLLPYLYRYKVSYGEQWKCGLFIFLSLFLRHNVHATVLMDGPNVYKEKDGERAKRTKNKNKIKEKCAQLKKDLHEYEQHKTSTPLLMDVSKDKSMHRNILLGTSPSVETETVRAYIDKMDHQMVSITPDDIAIVSHMCSLLSIPFYYASQEAESFASYLCIHGTVDVVVTEDTDVLAYGSPHWISSLSHDGSCTEIDLSDVIGQMELTREQFLDFCILCGTDYNESLPGVGPVSAYKHVREDMDALLVKHADHTKALRLDTVRAIFQHPCDVALTEFTVAFNVLPLRTHVLQLKQEKYPVQWVLTWLDSYQDKFDMDTDL